MSFLGNYFSEDGVVGNAFWHLDSERATYVGLRGTGTTLHHYVEALANAMSVVYSAIGAVWQFWNLCKIYKLIPQLVTIVAEYEHVRKLTLEHDVTIDPSWDQVYAASLLRMARITELLSFFDRNGSKEEVIMLRSKAMGVCEDILSRKVLPNSIRMLTQALIVNNPYECYRLRKDEHEALTVEIDSLLAKNYSPEQMELFVGQGYKTICRVARSIGHWEACRIAISKDGSLDLRMKTWLCPGYVCHMAIHIVTLGSLFDRFGFYKT